MSTARLWLLLLPLVLSACSSQQVALSDPEHDPWESYNRKIHAFNMGFDRVIFRPVARGYDRIMPDAPQRGVRNFFRNLAYPVTFLNLVLQGKFEESLTATGRFFMNSTIGLLGFFDVATKEEIPYYEEDFGQTLAVWGWKDSRFLMMPFIGPYTARDLRAELLPYQEELDSAPDPYIMVRDVWLQNREFRIYDGEPPAPDYDALLEDY